MEIRNFAIVISIILLSAYQKITKDGDSNPKIKPTNEIQLIAE